MSTAGWRPPQWSTQPQLWSVTATTPGTAPTQGTSVTSTALDENGNPLPGNNSTPTNTPGTPGTSGTPTVYYFDAVFSSDHFTTRTFTKHPVQNSASITDHSYQNPARVVLEVGFSDAMQSYSLGQYSAGSGPKSVNAYQQFVTLQKAGTPLQLATRLQNYATIGITEIGASDTYITAHAGRFSIVFEEILLAQVSTTVVSSRPDQSQQTGGGSEQSQSVPPALMSSHTSTQMAATPPSAPNDPNPNPNWSSDGQGYAAPGYGP